jgi:hypothetical protein
VVATGSHCPHRWINRLARRLRHCARGQEDGCSGNEGADESAARAGRGFCLLASGSDSGQHRSVPRDRSRLTDRQLRALGRGEVLRLPASHDIRGGSIPSRRFSVDIAPGAEAEIEALFEEFNDSDASKLLHYAERVLEFWDGDGASAEDLATRLGDGSFVLAVPSAPESVLLLHYVVTPGGRVLIIDGSVGAAGRSATLP